MAEGGPGAPQPWGWGLATAGPGQAGPGQDKIQVHVRAWLGQARDWAELWVAEAQHPYSLTRAGADSPRLRWGPGGAQVWKGTGSTKVRAA